MGGRRDHVSGGLTPRERRAPLRAYFRVAPMNHPIGRILRAALLLQTIGLLLSVGLGGGGLTLPAIAHWGGDSAVAPWCDRILLALLMAAAGSAALFRSRVGAGSTAALMGVVAVVSGYQAVPHVALEISAHATRWGLPLVLLIVFTARARGPHHDWGSRRVEALMRACVAGTFAAHGIEALTVHPTFVGLLAGTAQRLFGANLVLGGARATLRVIGTVDIVVALAVLVVPRRFEALLWYMAFWGFATAASRTMAMGWVGLGPTLLRVANGAMPLGLLLVSRSAAFTRCSSAAPRLFTEPDGLRSRGSSAAMVRGIVDTFREDHRFAAIEFRVEAPPSMQVRGPGVTDEVEDRLFERFFSRAGPRAGRPGDRARPGPGARGGGGPRRTRPGDVGALGWSPVRSDPPG